MRVVLEGQGVDDPAGFSLADLLLELGASQEMEEADAANTKCPQVRPARRTSRKPGASAARSVTSILKKASRGCARR